jgi:hypothetical protein
MSVNAWKDDLTPNYVEEANFNKDQTNQWLMGVSVGIIISIYSSAICSVKISGPLDVYVSMMLLTCMVLLIFRVYYEYVVNLNEIRLGISKSLKDGKYDTWLIKDLLKGVDRMYLKNVVLIRCVLYLFFIYLMCAVKDSYEYRLLDYRVWRYVSQSILYFGSFVVVVEAPIRVSYYAYLSGRRREKPTDIRHMVSEQL